MTSEEERETVESGEEMNEKRTDRPNNKTRARGKPFEGRRRQK